MLLSHKYDLKWIIVVVLIKFKLYLSWSLMHMESTKIEHH